MQAPSSDLDLILKPAGPASSKENSIKHSLIYFLLKNTDTQAADKGACRCERSIGRRCSSRFQVILFADEF